jgi:hypothetical protein
VEESFGPFDQDFSKLTYELGEGIIGYVVQTGEPKVIRSISESKEFLNKLHFPLKAIIGIYLLYAFLCGKKEKSLEHSVHIKSILEHPILKTMCNYLL